MTTAKYHSAVTRHSQRLATSIFTCIYLQVADKHALLAVDVSPTREGLAMLVFTNRVVTDTTTVDAFGKAFKPGSDQLGYATVDPSTPAADDWKLSEVDPVVSENDAYKLLEKIFKAGRPVLLYVHGNNNTPATCFKRLHALQTSYPRVEVIGFSWPSEGFLSNGSPLPELSAADLVAASTDGENNLSKISDHNRTKDTFKGKILRFHQAQNNAKHSVEAFARLLRLIAAARMRINLQPYSLAIHSLGAHLFQYALQANGATEAASTAYNVALLAPCVHTTAHKDWLARFRPKGRTYVTYNKGDSVLMGAFIADAKQLKLGADPGLDRVKASGVRYISFSDAKTNVGGHGYFVEPKHKALELFTRIFTSRIDFDEEELAKVVYTGNCEKDGTTCYMAFPKDQMAQG